MTLTQAKRKIAVRRDRFVVGYLGSRQVLFGVDRKYYGPCVDPLTREQAQQVLDDMPDSGAAIFEIVPVALNSKRRLP